MVAFQRGRALFGALALAFACATAGQAQTYDIASAHWTGNPGWVIGPIDYPTLGTYGEQEARIGPSLLKGTDGSGDPVSLLTWCIDLFGTLQPGTFTATDIAHSGFDAGKLTQVATFLEHAQPLAVDNNSAAAVQLGVWEILYEDSGSWNTASGTFYSPRLPAVSGIANTWLSALASNDWRPDPSLRLEVLVPDGINQAQVRLVAAPQRIGSVPEPATWGMMLIGFALAGAGMRRRRTQIAFS